MELIKETSTNSLNTPSSTALQQFVEFSWKATRGLVDATETQVEQLVEKLSDTGRISPEQKAKLSTLVGQRLSDSRNTFLTTIDQHIKTATEKLAELTTQELTKLEATVAQLEKRVSQLTV